MCGIRRWVAECRCCHEHLMLPPGKGQIPQIEARLMGTGGADAPNSCNQALLTLELMSLGYHEQESAGRICQEPDKRARFTGLVPREQ
jgi:hypothetical protein